MAFRETTQRAHKYLRNKRHLERQQKRTQYLTSRETQVVRKTTVVEEEYNDEWPGVGYSLPPSTVEVDDTPSVQFESGGGGDFSGGGADSEY